LCPSYHARAAWRLAAGAGFAELGTVHVGSCLCVLLLWEVLGSQPWALQQLAPHLAAQRAGKFSAAAAHGLMVGVQWPLLRAFMGSVSNDSGSGSGTGCRCNCCASTCHLCTPPPPVTLQQLRLVLEVVCLTCRESSQHALQAPVLLALLLQRASPGVRATFLNSADGVRLLVALQQAPEQTHQELTQLSAVNTWCFYNQAGALSARTAAAQSSVQRLLPPAITRAALALAWCFLEAVPGASAATAANEEGGGGSEGGLVTSASLAHGSMLRVDPANESECWSSTGMLCACVAAEESLSMRHDAICSFFSMQTYCTSCPSLLDQRTAHRAQSNLRVMCCRRCRLIERHSDACLPL
jgi:hypothetical protein